MHAAPAAGPMAQLVEIQSYVLVISYCKYFMYTWFPLARFPLTWIFAYVRTSGGIPR